MPKVLDYFREREPRFKDVTDEKLTRFIATRHPEFLQDQEFAQSYAEYQNPPSLRVSATFAEPQYASGMKPTLAPQFDNAALEENYQRVQQQKAADNAEKLQDSLAYHPLYQATKTLGRAGKVTLAAGADAAALATGQKPENLVAFANRPDAPTPVEEGLAELKILGDGFWNGALALGAKSSAALFRTAPTLGAGAGLSALGAAPTMANALAFGAAQEQGGFDPIGATIAAGLPGVTKAGETGVAALLEKLPTAKVVVEVLSKDPLKLKGKVVQQLGKVQISNDVFRKYLEAGGGLLAANAYLAAASAPEIMMLPPEQRAEAALDAVAVNMATSLSGFTTRKGPSITLENLMPKLYAEWHNQTGPTRARLGQPAEEGAPVPNYDAPTAYNPFSPTPVKAVTPNTARPTPVVPPPSMPPSATAGAGENLPSVPPAKEVGAGPPEAKIPLGEQPAAPAIPARPSTPNPPDGSEEATFGALNLPLGVTKAQWDEMAGLSERDQKAKFGVTRSGLIEQAMLKYTAENPPPPVPDDTTPTEEVDPVASDNPTADDLPVMEDAPQPAPTPPAADTPEEWAKGDRVASMVAGLLEQGQSVTPAQVRNLGEQLGLTERQSGEWAELAATAVARKIAQAPDMTDREKFHALVSLYDRMPTNAERTPESKSKQQYSTPPPLAWVASVLADFKSGKSFAEPTAGHGMLLIGVPQGSNVLANELDPARLARLNYYLKQFAGSKQVTQADASARQWYDFISRPVIGLDRVAQNPPFGTVLKPEGGNKEFEIVNAVTKLKTTTSIDLAIALNTFEGMSATGKGFAIIGAKTGTPYGGTFGTPTARADSYRSPAMMEFFERFNVVDWFTVGGDLYRKMGAAWPVDVIIVHGKGKTKSAKEGGLVRPWVTPPRVIETWEQLAELIPQSSNDNIKPGTGAGETSARPDGTRPSPPRGAGPAGPGKPALPAARPERPAGNGGAGGGTPAETPQVPNPTPPAPPRVPGDSDAGIGAGTPGPTEPVVKGGAKGGQPGAPGVGGAGPVAAGPSQNQPKQPDVKKSGEIGKQFEQRIFAAKTLAELMNLADEVTALFKDGKITEYVRGVLVTYLAERRKQIEGGDTRPAGPVAKPAPPLTSAPAVVKPQSPVEGLPASLMVKYQGVSKGPSLNLVAPRNIANQMLAAQQELEAQVGMPIDAYVADRLGRDVATLHTQLSGAQIDAAALAIRNIERGSALITADETGVGKGRVVAAILEYARLRGLVPIFVTAKKNLYADMVGRDLPALGNKDYIPFITDTQYYYEDGHGREVKGKGTASAKVDEMASVIRTGNLPGGAHAVFTTYDQLKADRPAGFKETPKQKFQRVNARRERPDGPKWQMIRALAPRAIFILDEAHLAAGPTSELNLKFTSILPAGRGAYYSSATFAKRPDNLGLYALGTLMKRTGLNQTQMTEALTKGGVPLQQALTSMLAESGELVRRQQDWTGVEMSFKMTATDAATDIEAADTYTEFIRDLMTLAEQVNEIGASLEDGENQVRADEETVKVEEITFGSRLFNLSNQYLLALRSPAIVREALAELKAGRKPFIALYNTMEGPLLDLRARKLPLSFAGILRREMAKMLKLTVRDPMAKDGKREVELKPEDLKDGGKFFRELERQINATDFSRFPISPIDYIKKGIQQAGYSVGELTARDGEVDDSGGEITISKRDKQERNKILSNYNNGVTDVIIVNGSGSTGLSAHTDPRFKDKRQRVMIVGQPAPDINEFMQMLGRVMRSGQLSKPVYRILITALAAERRFATMLRGKMTSLNANTTAEGESGMTQSEGFAEDIFNVVGDAVVFRVMQANEELAKLLDLGTSNEDAEAFDNFARYATGRFVLLPNADAQRLWDEIIEEYRNEIQQLDEAGENPLRATAEDLRARTLESTTLVEATGSTVFDGPANLEKAVVKPPQKPPTHGEALQRAKDNQPAIKQRVAEFISNSRHAEGERLNAAAAKGATAETLDKIRTRFQTVREHVMEAARMIGETYGYDAMGDGTAAFYGVAAELKLSGKQVSDFASASRQTLVLTTNTYQGKRTLPLSKLFQTDQENSPLQLVDEEDAAELFDNTAETNSERYIITGNLLRGFEAADEATNGREVGRPRVTIYTREDGSLNTGILMPAAWTPGEAGPAQQIIQTPVEFTNALAAGRPMRSLPTSSVHPIVIEGTAVSIPSSGQGKVLWSDPEFSSHFDKPPRQVGGNFIGEIYNNAKDQGDFFTWLASKGVRLMIKPAEKADMRGSGGLRERRENQRAARGGFVSGVPRTPGGVPPTVKYGGMNLVQPLQLPELLRLVRDATGQTPRLRKFPAGRNGQTLGQFGDGMITLDPRIFKDPEVAAKVFAHEIGHLADYLPHETLKRGNLLGHLLALRGFLKGTFGPLNNRELRAELLAVTKWWRPYDPVKDPKSYVQYRQSAEELYADAVSVLFNAPAELETRAPKFYTAFWEQLNRRPDVEAALFGIQELLNKGKLPTAAAREASLEEAFAAGEARWKELVAEREAAARSWDGWWTRLWQELYWNFYPLEQRAARVEKSGRSLRPENDPRQFLDDLGYRDVTVMKWGRHVHEKVIQPLESSGLTLVDAGKYLFYMRIMAGDRDTFANPDAITPEAAQLGLLKMNLELGLAKMTLLRDAIRIFHEDVFKLAEEAMEVGAYNRTTFNTVIRPNKDTYATFAVLKYLDDYIPAGIRQQVGTLEKAANPFQATILKSIGLINLIAYQRAKNKTVDFIRRYYPDELTPANTQHEPPPRRGFGTFMRLENGRPTWYYTDPYIADAFTKMNPRQLWWLTKAADGVFRRVIYPLIITYNPAFLYIMSPLRDVQRTARNLPGGSARYAGRQLGRIGLAAGPMLAGGMIGAATLGPVGAVAGGFVGANIGTRLLRRGSKMAGEVANRYEGQAGPLIRELEANLGLGTPFDQLARNNRDDFMADLLKRMRVMPDHELQGWYQSELFTPVRRLLQGLELGGLTLDAVAKTSAYQHLRRRGYSPKQAAYWVRNNAGLPNINKKGLLVRQIRALAPFWNVAMQGWRADLKNMSHPNTRAGWWLRYMATNGMIRALLAVAATGALGAALKELLSGVGEYDKTNYVAIPLGQSPGGEFGNKTVYIRVPEDESARLLGGIISKSIRALGPDDVKLADIFDFSLGQFPSFNPAVSVPKAWIEYATGHNPADPLRGRNIVPAREWEAGGVDSLKPMAVWTIGQTGVPNFIQWDSRSETTWELSLSAIPGVNKFLKVSDQGYREAQRATQSEAEAAKQREKLKLPKDVQSIEMEYWRLARIPKEARTEAQAARYDDLHFWYQRTYRPAWEAIQKAIDDQTPVQAEHIRRGLDMDSKPYYRRR